MSTLSESDIEKIANAIEKKAKKQAWHKHPLLLLFMSLIFTTIAGTALTTVIKNVDFKKRQLLLREEKFLEQKIKLLGELNTEYHQFTTTTNKLSNTYWDFSTGDEKVLPETFTEINEDQSASDIRWKTTFPFLISQMKIHFDNEKIVNKAIELDIVSKDNTTELSIFAITSYFYSESLKPSKIDSLKRKQIGEFSSMLTARLNKIDVIQEQLQNLMVAEIHHRENYDSKSIFVETWNLIFGN